MRVEREIFPAATDSRFLRELGVQAVGFSPMAHTPVLLHEHNEALSVRTFLDGIRAYEAVIPALANAPPSADSLTDFSKQVQAAEAATISEEDATATTATAAVAAAAEEPEAKRTKTAAQ